MSGGESMAGRRFRVVAPCIIHVPVATTHGNIMSTLYRDAVLEGDRVPADRLKHLLDSQLIEEIVEPGTVPEAATDPEKTDGGPPKINGRSSKGELIAYVVAAGRMTEDEAELLTAKDLHEVIKAIGAESSPSE